MEMLSPVDTIKGVGEKTAKYLNKLGVYTIEDILLFFPRTYLVYPEPQAPDKDSVNSLISISGRIKTSFVLKTEWMYFRLLHSAVIFL